MRTFDSYIQEALQKNPKCRWCGSSLKNGEFKMYSHPEGWAVVGEDKKQWIYIVCLGCHYEWAIWELGVWKEVI